MAIGTIRIIAHKAQDLHDTNLLGKQDPYAQFTLGDEKRKTKTHKKGGKNAKWEQTLEPMNVERHGMKFCVELLDEELIKDDFIGRAYVDIDELVAEGEPKWYRIGRGEGEKEDAGKVLLSIQFAPALIITCHKGTDLRDAEVIGKNDPYLVVAHDKLKKQTKVHKNAGKFPVWEERFIFFNENWIGESILFKCFDKDKLSSDLIGEVEVDVKELTKNASAQLLDLKYKGKDAGKIEITAFLSGIKNTEEKVSSQQQQVFAKTTQKLDIGSYSNNNHNNNNDHHEEQGGNIPTGQVSIQDKHGQYLGSKPNGAVYSTGHLKGWEKFTLGATGGKYFIKNAHGKYLGVSNNGSVYTVGHCKAWEKFDVVDLGSGAYAIKSHHNTYITSKPNKAGVFTTGHCKAWENFEIEKIY